jgi:hypothetical protein
MADGLVAGQAQASKYVAGGADQSFLGCGLQKGLQSAFAAHLSLSNRACGSQWLV